jgi:hypothetical protein
VQGGQPCRASIKEACHEVRTCHHRRDGGGARAGAGHARRLRRSVRPADYAQAGDFEGVLTYGIGYTRAILHSNPQTPVRAYEVETVTAAGQHRYVVAIDISTAQHG